VQYVRVIMLITCTFTICAYCHIRVGAVTYHGQYLTLLPHFVGKSRLRPLGFEWYHSTWC
jgi:hypothetical protein